MESRVARRAFGLLAHRCEGSVNVRMRNPCPLVVQPRLHNSPGGDKAIQGWYCHAVHKSRMTFKSSVGQRSTARLYYT